jgi:hypothetical protein
VLAISSRLKFRLIALACLAALAAPHSAWAQAAKPTEVADSPVALPIGVSPGTELASTPASASSSWMADKADYFTPFGFDWNDGKWFVSGYFGVAARDNLSTLLFRLRADYTRQYMVLGTLGREIGSLGNVRFEWETGFGVHFGKQEFVDAHLYLVVRWIAFPWNRWLPTTIAVGTGPSLASVRPDLENENGKAGYYKNGLMLELTVAPPDNPDWMLAARIHHRSSLFGLLDAGTPSDYVTIGIKHRF